MGFASKAHSEIYIRLIYSMTALHFNNRSTHIELPHDFGRGRLSVDSAVKVYIASFVDVIVRNWRTQGQFHTGGICKMEHEEQKLRICLFFVSHLARAQVDQVLLCLRSYNQFPAPCDLTRCSVRLRHSWPYTWGSFQCLLSVVETTKCWHSCSHHWNPISRKDGGLRWIESRELFKFSHTEWVASVSLFSLRNHVMWAGGLDPEERQMISEGLPATKISSLLSIEMLMGAKFISTVTVFRMGRVRFVFSTSQEISLCKKVRSKWGKVISFLTVPLASTW